MALRAVAPASGSSILPISGTGATVTTSQPLLNLSQTWNAGGVTFTGAKLNVTDTASAAASLLLDLQTGGVSQFRVRKDGQINFNGYAYSSAGFQALSDTGIFVAGAGQDALLVRKAAANWQFGNYDAAAPVAQTLGVQSVVAGTSNTSGADWSLALSAGTGSGASGKLVLLGALSSAAATTQNSRVRTFDFGNTGAYGTFNIYNTYTDASNYARIRFTADPVRYAIFAEALGTGVGVNMSFGTRTGNNLYIHTNSVDRWNFDFNGHFLTTTDNVYDIGASGATRPRTVYVGTNVFAGGNVFVDGSFVARTAGSTYGVIGAGSSTAGTIKLSDNAGTSFDRLQFGGTTSSYPALKRVGANLQVVLADASAFAIIQGKLTTDTNYTAGAAGAATGYIVIYDATGTAYKVEARV